MRKIQSIYDLFEKDISSDIQALTNISKRISGNKEILIQFNDYNQIISTNGSVIHLPVKFKKDIKTAQGLVAHESGHVGYGSFEIAFIKLVPTLVKKYDFNPSITKQLINVVEDVRIDAINKEKFPGFHRNLQLYTLSIMPELKRKMKFFGDLLLYINLFMEGYESFQEKPRFRTIQMKDCDWKSIEVARDFLLKSLSPSASIIVCDQVCKIMKKYLIKKKPIPIKDPKERDFFEEPIDFERILEEFDDVEFLEDPIYYECENRDLLHDIEDFARSYINHFEDFSQNEDTKGSEIQTASDKMVEKIKDIDLNTEDLENLISQIENLENNEEITENSKISLICENLTNPTESKEQDVDIEEEVYNGDVLEYGDPNSKFVVPNCEVEFINLKEVAELLSESDKAMENRILLLERFEFKKNDDKILVIEKRIENDRMMPISLTYNRIIRKFRGIITKVNLIFNNLKNENKMDNFQRRGRLNKNFIKTITSDFKFNRCFTRKIKLKELKLLLMVDISGSMRGKKLECAKIAMIMLCEALKFIAKIRVVLFTGEVDARNILMKDFDEPIDTRRFDRFGMHRNIQSNLDGVSIKHEAKKLESNEIIIVISDGQPAGRRYNLSDAIPDVHDVRKRFKIFAFSIDAQGEHLNKLYGNNWILAHSRNSTDLGEKIIKFCRLVVKEF